MPTVIIPPTDVSPNTGSGSEVLSTSPNLITPTLSVGATTTGSTDLLINPTTKASGNLIDAQVNGSSKFSVTSAGAGTFGGNLTVSGTGNNQLGGSGANVGLGTAPNASAGTYIKNTSGFTLLVDTGRTDNGLTGIFLRNNAGGIRGWVGFNPTETTLHISGNGGGTVVDDNLTVNGTGTSSVAGNFGIGTTAPTTSLHIAGSTGSSTDFALMGSNVAYAVFDKETVATAGNAYGIRIGKYGYSSLAIGWNKNTISGDIPANAAYIGINSADKDISFAHQLDTTPITRVLIKSTGNFLIGTTTDGGQKLQVNGTAAIAGNLTVTGDITTASGYVFKSSGHAYLDSNTGQNVYLRTNGGTIALTLDSSQHATFSQSAKFGNSISDVTQNAAIVRGGRLSLRQYNSSVDRGLLFIGDGTNGTTADEVYIRSVNTVTHFQAGASGTTETITIAANGDATFAGAIAIGNTVAAAAGVASTHKVTISIGGTTYYLLATNV